MTWTNGETTVGDIGFRGWRFEEVLTITGQDTTLPCEEGAVFSPYLVTVTYAWSESTPRKWVVQEGTLYGPRVLGEWLGEEVEARFDRAGMYVCPADECPHPDVAMPGWLERLLWDRMALLPTPSYL